MTAYTVRDRKTAYERNMANPDEDELFSNKIVSRYDLCDALIDSVLPKPIYKSARIKLFLTEKEIEEKVLKLNPNSKDYEDIIFYTSTSEMGDEGKLNRQAFYDDVTLDGKSVDGKLRIMFAINQYNEGIHAPNVNKVIMGRGLSARENYLKQYEELEKLSIDELIQLCNEKDIRINNDLSKSKIIEKLIAPVIIDLAGNIDFIKELENNLKNRIKEISKQSLGKKRQIKISDALFDIEVENEDLYEILKYVTDRLTMTWESKYELAKAYYEHYGNLEIPQFFKTINGIDYDENGISLGNWIRHQRENKNLSEQRKEKLIKIGMRFIPLEEIEWMKKYELAKSYYEHHGNLEIPIDFKTKNGIDYDENGSLLGEWIRYQRKNKKLSKERINLLHEIDMIWYKKYFEKLEINPSSKDKIKNQLLVKLKNILIKLPNDIKSKEDIDKLNQEFNDSLGKKK